MKNLFLVFILLSFLFFHIVTETMNYQEYAKKWYSGLQDKKFSKEERLLVVGQIIAINQCLSGLQMEILNKVNEEHYTKSKSEDELKISEDILNTLKKENEKSIFRKLKSFYNAYKTFNKIKKIMPCIKDIFEYVCGQQYKKEEIEKIVQDLIFVILLKANADDEKIKSLLSIITPIQTIFAEIIKLSELEQNSGCVIL